MPIKTYTFGLLEPTRNADLVVNQMLLAHRYRNLLTEIERERLDTVRAALSSHLDVAPIEAAIAELVPKLEEARTAITKARSATRSRSETAGQRARVREVGAQLRELRSQRKAARQAIAKDPDVRAKADMAEVHARDRVRQARAACGVYWGTYLLQEADADRARQSATQPRFKRWTGDGRVSVQLQGGLKLDELWGTDTRVRIGGPPLDAGPTPRPFSWPVCRAKRLHLRIGSDENKRPVWAEWPVIMSRDLPDGSTIKVATVSRYRDGTTVPIGEPRSEDDCKRWRWTLHLTVDVPEASIRSAPAAGVVALNLGFCRRPGDTIRSGYIVGDDGHEEEILVPKRDIDAMGKADDIRSIRDRNMDTMRAELGAWLGTAGRDLPEWLVESTKFLPAWKSFDRFSYVALLWKHRRFPGDDVAYDLIDAWRRRDLHLDQYEHGLRTTAIRRRQEAYRVAAARLASRYRTLIVDDTDLSDLQRAPSVGSDEPKVVTVKRQQRLAAGSVLRGAMQNAFRDRCAKVSAAWMTRCCYQCGSVDLDWETKDGMRSHECPACHATWDRDANLCRNLIRERARAESAPKSSPDDVTPKKTRQQRLRGRREATPGPEVDG